jgi:hypothetical protein
VSLSMANTHVQPAAACLLFKQVCACVCVRYSFVSPKTEIPGAERVFCACREIRANTRRNSAVGVSVSFAPAAEKRGARHKFKLHPSACV